MYTENQNRYPFSISAKSRSVKVLLDARWPTLDLDMNKDGARLFAEHLIKVAKSSGFDFCWKDHMSADMENTFSLSLCAAGASKILDVCNIGSVAEFYLWLFIANGLMRSDETCNAWIAQLPKDAIKGGVG